MTSGQEEGNHDMLVCLVAKATAASLGDSMAISLMGHLIGNGSFG